MIFTKEEIYRSFSFPQFNNKLNTWHMKKLFFLLCILFSFHSYAGEITVKDFSNGVLLVRLNSGSKQLEFYKEKYPEKAQKLAEKIDSENQELMTAFSEQYKYSKVLFFYSDDAESIKNRNYKAKLFTADMSPVKEFDYKADEIFIARLGSTFESTLAIASLVLYNADFNQLEKPFPYYVRTYEGIGFLERSKKNLISRLNTKLMKYKKTHDL